MRALFCLILLMGEGGFLLFTHPSFLGLSSGHGSWVGGLWHTVLSLIAIPLCFFLLLFTKRDSIKFLVWSWAIFLSLLTILYLFSLETISPEVTLYGKLFVMLVLITCVALTLFESIDLFELPTKIKKPNDPGQDPPA